ncbi:putative endonuclease [Halpernia humi]|uniref:Putative endonuclease n=1 Tax=Halpernia humi TaxID=493375 RepID=A0A1H6AIB9_9FLAO|nr:GIY-YIG nuclease family protein [Halpernia humi]SEG48499.1 putative endonuclease [Halpernia humi]
MTEVEYFVYVLKSEVDGRLYKGQTSNLEKRLKEHNSGKTKSTKGFIPWRLVYFEIFASREEALLREKYFKSGIGREFLKEMLNRNQLQ